MESKITNPKLFAAQTEWKQCYTELCSYFVKNGDFQAPAKSALFAWIRKQRKTYSDGKLNQTQIDLLEDIGFKWTDNTGKRTPPVTDPILSSPVDEMDVDDFHITASMGVSEQVPPPSKKIKIMKPLSVFTIVKNQPVISVTAPPPPSRKTSETAMKMQHDPFYKKVSVKKPTV